MESPKIGVLFDFPHNVSINGEFHVPHPAIIMEDETNHDNIACHVQVVLDAATILPVQHPKSRIQHTRESFYDFSKGPGLWTDLFYKYQITDILMLNDWLSEGWTKEWDAHDLNPRSNTKRKNHKESSYQLLDTSMSG